jgi:hypothetical protein
MPVYHITDPKTGRTLAIEGDHPPTQEDAAAIFAANPESLGEDLWRQATHPLQTMTRTLTPPEGAVEMGIEALPGIGGAVGGILGGTAGAFGAGVGAIPGGMAGAGLGAAAGSSLKHMMQRARGKETPGTWGALGTDIAKDAAINATLEGVGGVAAPYVARAGGKLYEAAAGRLSERFLNRYPTAVQDALASGTVLSTKGAKAAKEAVTASHELADQVIAAAQEAGGTPINQAKEIIRPVVAELRPGVTREARAGLPQGRSSLIGRIREIRREARAPRSTPPPVPEPPPRIALPEPVMPEVPTGPIVARVKPEPVIKAPRPQKAKDLVAEFGVRNPEEATDLFGETTHSGMGAFRHEPVPTGRVTDIEARIPPATYTQPVRPSGGITPVDFSLPESVIQQISRPTEEIVTKVPRLFEDVPLVEAQATKRRVQDLANQAFRAGERGAPVNAHTLQENEAIARAYRQAIEQRVPEVAEINKQTQKLFGISELAKQAGRRGSGMKADIAALTVGGSALPLWALAGRPGAAAAALASGIGTKVLTSPGSLSRLGIAANRAGTQAIQANFYRAVLEALRQGLETPTPPQ